MKFDDSNTFFSIDLIEAGILPADWINQINNVAEEHSEYTKLDGMSSTSREDENSKETEVYVVTGEVIYNKLQWLYNLYKNEFIKFANTYFNNQYEIANDKKSSMNINILTGRNSRYEKHVDSNPLTGVLYVTTHKLGEGGDLVFETEKGDIHVYPKSGQLILFDARKIIHYVKPLLDSTNKRISIPMNFYSKGEIQLRPNDLDEYMY